MSDTGTLLLVLGNLAALVSAFALFVGWFRRWLVKQVSEPVADVARQLVDVKGLAERAHERLDRHLEQARGMPRSPTYLPDPGEGH